MLRRSNALAAITKQPTPRMLRHTRTRSLDSAALQPRHSAEAAAAAPSAKPSAEPSAEPSVELSAEPSAEPSVQDAQTGEEDTEGASQSEAPSSDAGPARPSRKRGAKAAAQRYRCVHVRLYQSRVSTPAELHLPDGQEQPC